MVVSIDVGVMKHFRISPEEYMIVDYVWSRQTCARNHTYSNDMHDIARVFGWSTERVNGLLLDLAYRNILEYTEIFTGGKMKAYYQAKDLWSDAVLFNKYS